jgi:pyruvate/2-oxoglutarate dehydrogenase complex dihydrolipoamide acyltransferase (E2) component
MFKDYKISYIEKNLNITGKKHLSYLRQTVAYALSQSINTIPHAAMITDYDVTPLIEYAKSSEKNLTPNSDETPSTLCFGVQSGKTIRPFS